MFHRVDDWRSIDGPRYFRLALRLAAYRGVMAVRVEEEREHGPRVAYVQPSAPRRAQVVDDPNGIAKLEAQGWLEHKRG